MILWVYPGVQFIAPAKWTIEPEHGPLEDGCPPGVFIQGVTNSQSLIRVVERDWGPGGL